jgi:hypothetical protein
LITKKGNYFVEFIKKRIEEELRALTHSQKVKSGFGLPIDDENNNKNESV